MAISSNKVVNVSSQILTETTLPRDFSGLVISKGTPISSTAGIGKDYADGEIVSVNANTYANLFGSTTPEFEFASQYFSYVSKSGTIPSNLKFMKLKEVASAAAAATAMASGTLTSPTVNVSTMTGKMTQEASATISKSVSSTITNATVDVADFSTAVSGKGGVYVFTCSTGGASATWKLGTETVDLDDYGIETTGNPTQNDTLTVVFVAAKTPVDCTLVFSCTKAGAVGTADWTLGGEEATLSQYGVSYSGSAAINDTITVIYTAARTASTEAAVTAFKRATDSTVTFGSFTFLSGKSTGVSNLAQLRAAATYNASLNNRYRMVVDYSLTSTDTNYYDNYVTKTGSVIGSDTDLWNISGLTLCNYCSSLTMARLAATDYTGTNTTSCDMFKSASGVPATVTTDELYETLVERRLNFVGLVKEHGNQWSWYMRGFNMDGTDTACYDNEMWFKSEIVKDLLSLEDRLEKIPANADGVAYAEMAICRVANMAVKNGTILIGKPLSSTKRMAIIQITGSESSISTLTKNGYIVSVQLDSEGEEYTIKYKVIYLKGDSVRKIEGAHVVA